MNSRTRFLITTAVVCHLLLTPFLFTSELLAQNIPDFHEATGSGQKEDISISAVHEEKQGPFYTLKDNVEIHYGVFVLRADQITYNDDTGDAVAIGHVVLEGGPEDEHLEATRGTYNTHTEVGRFEHVHATIGLRLRNKKVLLTSPNPFVFNGKVVEKTGPGHYRVYGGMITTCELPHPKWQFNAGKIVVDAGGNATIYNTIFRIRGVPVLYLPFATHPIDRQERQSGFLMPNVGHSSIKGTILGDSFYWAINHRMDATFGVDYYSQRGWAPLGEFRARPTENSFMDVNVFSVLDRKSDSGADVTINAGDDFSDGFRGVVKAEYLSSYAFRLTFYDLFSQIANSEVTSRGFVSKNTDGYSLDAGIEQYRNFESSTDTNQVVSILHAPSFEASTVDRQLGRSPFYWNFDAAVDGLSRSEPTFSTTPLLGRFDLSPTILMPLISHGWSLVPSFSLRETLYTQELFPSNTPGTVGVAGTDLVNRKALEGSVQVLPPPIERVFNKPLFGRKWKHVIEPMAQYNYVTGVNNFANILRFDDRDILSDTNEVEYGIVNRLYAKRLKPAKQNCGQEETLPSIMGGEPQNRIPWEKGPVTDQCAQEPGVREVMSWELKQKYFLDPTFGGALVPGERNVFTTTADLTGIAFLSTARHLSPLVSLLRVQTSSRTDADWEVDYDFTSSKINASTALVNYHFGQFTVGGGEALVQVPSAVLQPTVPQIPSFDQFRLLLGYGNSGKRGFSGAASVGYDVNLNSLQYSSLQAAYNWDCCGLNVEYRRFALGSIPNENQYRFSFVLSNIGSFGNLKRQERLF